jgi:hypothetical protein
MDFDRALERLTFAVELNHSTRALGFQLRSRATSLRLEAESLKTEAKLLRGSLDGPHGPFTAGVRADPGG